MTAEVEAAREQLDILHRWTFGAEGEWDKDAARKLIELTTAALDSLPTDIETEWAETLRNDGVHEFTTTGDCHGGSEQHYRRTPRRVIPSGVWEKIQ